MRTRLCPRRAPPRLPTARRSSPRPAAQDARGARRLSTPPLPDSPPMPGSGSITSAEALGGRKPPRQGASHTFAGSAEARQPAGTPLPAIRRRLKTERPPVLGRAAVAAPSGPGGEGGSGVADVPRCVKSRSYVSPEDASYLSLSLTVSHYSFTSPYDAQEPRRPAKAGAVRVLRLFALSPNITRPLRRVCDGLILKIGTQAVTAPPQPPPLVAARPPSRPS